VPARHRRRRIARPLSFFVAVTLVLLICEVVSPIGSGAATPIAIDANVSTHQSANGSSIASPAFSTAQANEVLVAFVSSDGPNAAASQSISAVSGAGLTWKLRQRTNGQAGDAEIWQATATAVLKNVTVTATRSSGSYQGAIDVVSFVGASTTATGATGTQSAASGAPTVSVTTTVANSWVWAVGNDWSTSTARTIGAGQTMLDQYLDGGSGDTFWAQYQTSQGAAAGSKVTVNDLAPTGDRWNLAAIEIVPAAGADTAAPSVPANLKATASSPTVVALTWSASTDNIAVAGYNIYRNNTRIAQSTSASYNDPTAAANTAYSYAVSAYDAAGNTSAQTGPVAVTTPSFTAPTVTITSRPAALSNSAAATFSFSATNTSDPSGGLSYQCSLDGTGAACASPRAYSGLANGAHTFTVVATDTVDGLSSVPASYGWTVDTIAPAVSIVTPTSASTVSGSVGLTSSASDANGVVSVQYRLDGAVLGGVLTVSPYSLSWNSASVPDGLHTITSTATDAAGNTGSAGATVTVSNVVHTAPIVSILTHPAAAASSASASFSFSATNPSDAGGVLSYRCSLDAALPVACSSPQGFSGLAEGAHSFGVTATDTTDGLTSAAATFTWTVDTTAPAVMIATPAAGAVVSGSVDLTSTASDAGGVASVQYRVDGALLGAAVTVSPYLVSWNSVAVADGLHTITSTATDGSGNVATAALTVTVSNVVHSAPVASIAGHPAALSNTAAPTFGFSVANPSDPAGVVGYSCSLDNAAAVGCASAQAYSALADGAHLLSVVATDTTDGLSSPPASFSWTVDTTAPVVSVVTPTNGTTVFGSVNVTSSASDANGITGVQYRLDGAPLGSVLTVSPYSSPWTSTSVADGLHTITATATDGAGNTAVATSAFTVSNVGHTAPVVSITSHPATLSNSATASFGFSAVNSTDPAGVLGYSCSVDGAAAVACTSPRLFPALADGAHTFSVLATDATDGLSSAAVSFPWTVDTTAPGLAILTPASGATVSGSVSLTSNPTDASGITGVQYRLDGAVLGAVVTIAPYSSTWNTLVATQGAHTITATATDAAGNSATATVTVQVSNPPILTINSQPAALVNSAAANFTFSTSNVSDPSGVLTYACSLDGAAAVACATPRAYSALADGPHTFSVVATDVTDGLSSSAAAASWTVDTTAPVVAVAAPVAGTTVSGSVTLASSATDANGIASVQYVIDGVKNGTATVPGGFTYIWNSVTVANGSHTIASIATDAVGNVATSLPITVTVSNTTTLGSAASIWTAATVPGTISDSDPSAVELGLKFQSSVATTVTGVRFYKGAANTGTHTGSLWTSTGTQLATVTFANETASGWQQALFSAPVAITANTTYVIGYHTAVGHYSANNNYFASGAVTTGNLTALANSTAGGNGVYAYGAASAFPTQTYQASNYWVDVVTSIATSTGPVDATPPSAPAGLVAAVNGSTVKLVWTAATDNVAVAGYNVYRNSVLIGKSPTLSYTDATASVSTTYAYAVSAYDDAGNVSILSALVSATTQGPTPIFSDNFDGTSLSPAWTVISRHGEYAQNETECNAASQVTVAANVLSINTIAQATSCGDRNLDGSVRHAAASWPYLTGDVQWSSFNFTYGTVSITGKYPPKSTSTWPSFWLLGSNCQQTNPVTADTGYSTCPGISTANYTEIDMVECYNNQWCQLALDQPTGAFPVCVFSPATDANWHTYSMVWNPTSITTYVDGVSTGCSFTAAAGWKIPSTPMFLIMQTQTGGVSGTPANLPTSLQISNVTVTQP
jgi:Domain of unknown function (DUF4082)/Bacterial Ig domain/Glycosyl hydrolases family 16